MPISWLIGCCQGSFNEMLCRAGRDARAGLFCLARWVEAPVVAVAVSIRGPWSRSTCWEMTVFLSSGHATEDLSSLLPRSPALAKRSCYHRSGVAALEQLSMTGFAGRAWMAGSRWGHRGRGSLESGETRRQVQGLASLVLLRRREARAGAKRKQFPRAVPV